jgi:hypothetical protein
MDADYCRRQAEHYRTCARHMSDSLDKAEYFGLAAYWARLAEKAAEPERPSDAGAHGLSPTDA